MKELIERLLVETENKLAQLTAEQRVARDLTRQCQISMQILRCELVIRNSKAFLSECVYERNAA